jgi:hypothetical protein
MDRRENRSTKVTKNTYNEIAKKSKGNCFSIPAKLRTNTTRMCRHNLMRVTHKV